MSRVSPRTPTSIRLNHNVADVLGRYAVHGFNSKSEMIEIALLLLVEAANGEEMELVDYMETNAYMAASDFIGLARAHILKEPTEAAKAVINAMRDSI